MVWLRCDQRSYQRCENSELGEKRLNWCIPRNHNRTCYSANISPVTQITLFLAEWAFWQHSVKLVQLFHSNSCYEKNTFVDGAGTDRFYSDSTRPRWWRKCLSTSASRTPLSQWWINFLMVLRSLHKPHSPSGTGWGGRRGWEPLRNVVGAGGSDVQKNPLTLLKHIVHWHMLIIWQVSSFTDVWVHKQVLKSLRGLNSPVPQPLPRDMLTRTQLPVPVCQVFGVTDGSGVLAVVRE